MTQALGRVGDEALLEEIGLDDEAIARRKAYFDLGDEDVQRLVGVADLAAEWVDGVIEDLYDHLLAFEETRAFFLDPKVLGHVQSMQRRYFLALTGGDYGRAYFADRLRVGATHRRVGLPIRWYLGAYAVYLRSIGNRLFTSFADDPARALAVFLSMQKLVMLDISLAIDVYEHTIVRQAQAIRELSTPVLQLRDGLLLLPIIGLLDTQRARQTADHLLRTIRETRARVVVIDITGVPAVDSKVANHLLQTAEACRLMGATPLLTGITPEVAAALVAIGAELEGLRTLSSLQFGIEEAERLLAHDGRALAGRRH